MPQCGFARRETSESACRSASAGENSEPSRPATEVGPVIDAPVISAIPFPPSMDGTEEVARHDGFSDRTLTGSATQRARTPTPPPLPSFADPSKDDDRKVTLWARRSSSRTGSPHPLLCPIPQSVPATSAGNKH